MMGVTVVIRYRVSEICFQRNMMYGGRVNATAKGEVMPSEDVIGAQGTWRMKAPTLLLRLLATNHKTTTAQIIRLHFNQSNHINIT